jgi:tRNA1Val (adenine37-N6)-methyltransferase
VLEQPQRGYRFTHDPLLLAAFVLEHARPAERVADLGAGSGVLGLSLLVRMPGATLRAAELQPRLVEIARRNVDLNGLADRAQVIEVDLGQPMLAKRALAGASFELAVSNPPYQALGRGDVNPDDEQAIARHELRLTLPRLCAEMRRVLVPDGQAAIVYPAARLDELLAEMRAVDLAARVLQPVCGRAGEAASRVLAMFDKGRAHGKLTLLAPLVEHEADGAPSAALRAATEG